VILPGGRSFYSGSIALRSNVEFHIEAGARLTASADLMDYAELDSSGAGVDKKAYDGKPCHAFIYAIGESNVAISGFGCIDGNFEAFTGESTQYHTSGKSYPRPAMIYIEKGSHITVKDITLQNAPFWTFHPAGCQDVLITGIRILNNLKMANCDGIDPDHCKNVRISNCHIETADDCIVLKNTKDLEIYGPTENVIITCCTLVSTSAAIKIGTDSVNDFRNICVSDCIISKSNRGLSIQVRDKGNVENVRFSNIFIETRRFYDAWWGKAEPIYVTSVNRYSSTKSGKIKNIYFQNITCDSENGVFLCGREDNPLQEIYFDNIQVEISKTTRWQGGVYDLRPCETDGLIYRDNPAIYCAYTKNVTFRNTTVKWGENLPEYFGSALEACHSEGLKLENFDGCSAHPDRKNISIT
jgi:hypothetical protein